MNRYQVAKARAIVAFLFSCQEQSSLTRHDLARCVAIMSHDQWRTVSLQAGVAVADIPAKSAVLAMLRGKAIHAL